MFCLNPDIVLFGRWLEDIACGFFSSTLTIFSPIEGTLEHSCHGRYWIFKMSPK